MPRMRRNPKGNQREETNRPSSSGCPTTSRRAEISAEEFAELDDIVRQEDPVEWLSEQLNITAVKGSELVTISLAARHPKNAQRILNAAVTAYLSYHETERMARVLYVIDELEQAKKDQESVVRELRGQLEAKAEGAAKLGASGRSVRSCACAGTG